MPAIHLAPAFDAAAFRRGVETDLAFVSRTLHTGRSIIMGAGNDNHIAEVLVVIATIIVSMTLLLYWGITREGSCERSRKR